MTSIRLLSRVVATILTTTGGPFAGAQTAATPTPPLECKGEIVSRIDVHPLPPFPLGGPWFLSRVASFVTSLHSTTREAIVRRYLTLQVGEPCTELQRLESERILRAQPFLASATVAVLPDSDGRVIIDVTTVDEVSLVLDGNAAAKAPILRSLHLGEANLNGEAIYLAGAWDYNQYYRDNYKGRLTDYQFLGHPYQFSLEGVRDEFGSSWDGEVSAPFLTETQTNSWRIAMGNNNGYASFLRPGALTVSLRSERAYGDVGGVHAFGPLRRRILVGASFSRERERTAYGPVVVLDSGTFPDTSSALTGRYGAHQSSRVNLLLGYRDIDFMAVKGFDAPEGTQDVRTGFQVATLLGRGIKLSDADERDYFFSGDLYAGAGSPTSFVALETMGERRFDIESHEWNDILGSGRAAWYFKSSSRNTFITDAEFSGGGRELVPFQLTFADREGGLRGYGASQLGGAERLITRFEDRRQLGHLRQFLGLTGAVFLDAGRLWAGDVPFGVTTPVKYSTGLSLLAVVPPTSRRVWRIDFAQPINDPHDAHFEVRITVQDLTQWFWREPRDIQVARERSIPNSVYNWP